MDGWIDGWIDGWMYGWMDGLCDGAESGECSTTSTALVLVCEKTNDGDDALVSTKIKIHIPCRRRPSKSR